MNFINHSKKNFLILTGPRKCGKTFCFKQVEAELSNVKYYNFKYLVEDDVDKIFEEISKTKQDTIFLLDEITYIRGFSEEFAKIAEEYTYPKGRTSKLIITGSQSFAIRNAAHRAYATDAEYIQTNFIDFEEWLLYRGKISEYGEFYEPREEDCLDYIVNVSEFTNIDNNMEYIKSCIDETIISESKSYQLIYGMVSAYECNVSNILAIMYASLFSLHEQLGYSKFFSYHELLMKVKTCIEDRTKLKASDLNKAIENRIMNHITPFEKMTVKQLKLSVQFLKELDLVTIVEQVKGNPSTSLRNWFYQEELKYDISNPVEFFKTMNICVKNPLFYINILKELLLDLPELELKDILSRTIRGSMIECLLRGLLTYKDGTDFQYEFRCDNGEVDYINFCKKLCMEFSIKNKEDKETHFYKIPNNEEFKKVLITKDKEYNNGVIDRVAYPKELLRLSRGHYVKPDMDM